MSTPEKSSSLLSTTEQTTPEPNATTPKFDPAATPPPQSVTRLPSFTAQDRQVISKLAQEFPQLGKETIQSVYARKKCNEQETRDAFAAFGSSAQPDATPKEQQPPKSLTKHQTGYKLQTLKELFPTIDKQTMEDVYVKADYDIDKAKAMLENITAPDAAALLRHGELIGGGAVGTVTQVYDQSIGAAASKEVLLKKDDALALKLQRREITYLEEVSKCPNIVRLISSSETATSEGWTFKMVMQLGGNTLSKALPRVPTEFRIPLIKIFMKHVTLALEALHSRCIAHRDIKPDNILIGNYVEDIHLVSGNFSHVVFRLCDLGFALKQDPKTFSVPSDEVYVGSLSYMAPELLHHFNVSYDPMIDLRICDLWSLGVVLFELITGGLQYCEDPLTDPLDFKEYWQDFEFTSHYVPSKVLEQLKAQPEAFDLVKGLMQVNPKKRLTLEQVKSHRFLNL